uniref:Transient receptor ion channel domain-containing protein n=1 Tax=Timema shepardi TaxID=629360 RepID=A0A7R9B1H0_TIMSH|nr:unnamed protein product [Timema shepardi]
MGPNDVWRKRGKQSTHPAMTQTFSGADPTRRDRRLYPSAVSAPRQELLTSHSVSTLRTCDACLFCLQSWENVDWNISMFTPDITPLILAAHRNNYEILKILLDRGATLPMPHDIKCGCEECLRDSNEDSLRHSMSRVNEYRALASPSLIALSSNDPILTAFQLRQCQKFAVDLLHQSRSSQELAIILNHDPESPSYEDGEHMKLARLELAINYKQKKFVAHPNIQQLLAALWYEGLPGFRRKPMLQKCLDVSQVALLFPFYCMLYMVAPNTATGKLMRKPFMKFLIHASSYLFFLLILILVSQHAEVQVTLLFGTETMKTALQEQLLKQRGNSPTFLEWVVVIYVLGFIWEETMEISREGMRCYLRNMWNFIDFTRNSLYAGTTLLRVAAYVQQCREISKDPATAYIPREQWDDFDPQLVAEGLFAAANVFSALKLVHLFSINPHLGPLQISLGRMVIDIVKFFFIYSLVLFAFACGLNQLLGYFADLERVRCYHLPGGIPDWENNGDACMKWRRFGNLFESSQSLFWASFGGVGIDSFELTGIKTYTRFWGLLMFGSYSVINVIVLLNLLIAMMSNSYAMITEHSDIEWKFARTRLWLSYFEESATLPPPFNIFPTPKHIMKLLGMRKEDKLRRMSTRRKERHEKERDYRYTAVMRSLVWRYVSTMHRQAEDNPVTEDDINEVKTEVSAMKCQLLEVLGKNGMDISCADSKEKTIMGKKMRMWERRLMKDFHLAPVTGEEELDQLKEPPPENEDSLARFRRIAKLAVINSSAHKWGEVVRGACQASQIGRCNNRESFKNQQNLRKAMEQAQRLVMCSPVAEDSRSVTPIPLPETTGESIRELLKDITEQNKELGIAGNNSRGPGGRGGFLSVGNKDQHSSRATTPIATLVKTLKEEQKTVPNSAIAGPEKNPLGKTDESRQKTAPGGLSQPPASTSKKQYEHLPLNDDPSPLIPTRKPNGESPPKVIKRKAPSEVPGAAHKGALTPQTMGPENKSSALLPKFEVTLAQSVNNNNNPGDLGKATSTEQLISPSPEPLRPGKRVEDVNTIKRVPKAGWL